MKVALMIYLNLQYYYFSIIVLIYSTIVSNIQKSSGQGSGWIIDSVIDHHINISKHNPLAGDSGIKLPTELDHSRKGLVNIQDIDYNECFKWCLDRNFHPADCNPARITKTGKNFSKKPLTLKT